MIHRIIIYIIWLFIIDPVISYAAEKQPEEPVSLKTEKQSEEPVSSKTEKQISLKNLNSKENEPLFKADKSIEQYRTPFDVLTEKTLGSTSRPIRFDWRRTIIQAAANVSHLAELNNFNSIRKGCLLRFPSNEMLFEIGLNYVWVWNSESTKSLALTPYRQPARPKRLELDFGIGYPLAEGIVTAWPKFFPAIEMVFNAYGDLRYFIYPSGFSNLSYTDVAKAIINPKLTNQELTNLEDERLNAMQIDTARVELLTGLGTDFYFQTGFFISSRVLLAVPLLSPMSGSKLLFWYDFSLSFGFAL